MNDCDPCTGDLGRVAVSPKGDGLYCRSPELTFLPLPEGAAKRVSPASVAAALAAARLDEFAVTADGKTAYLSGRGQLLKVALDSGEREAIRLQRIGQAGSRRSGAAEVGARREVGGTVQRTQPCLARNYLRMVAASIFMAAGCLWQQSLDGKPARRLLEGDAWSASRHSRRTVASSRSCAAKMVNESCGCWTWRAGKRARWLTWPTVPGRGFQAGAATASGSCFRRAMLFNLPSGWSP